MGFVSPQAFRIDLLVEERLILEIKSVDKMGKAHAKQLLTYLRLTKQPVGLLLNFSEATMMDGVIRLVNDYRPGILIPLRSLRLCANIIFRSSNMFDLHGMTALVTGASGGIGSEIAKALAAQGARLAISGSNAQKLRLFREQLDEHTPQHLQEVDHVAITCDLSNPDEVEKLVPAAVDTLGKLDILVNNAGITRDNLAMRMKDEEWDAVIRVNLEAAFRLMRAASKPMMKARFGRIITITSVVGATGNPGQINYAAAKGGLTAMSKSLGQELASRGITVNCVAPGFIRTAMTDTLPDAQKEALNARIPMGRMGEGEDIGAAVAYLASREAGYITGQTLHVNGGMAMLS